jgi:hypothetical protein
MASGTAAAGWQPLELTLADKDKGWPQRLIQWTWAFVALGVAIRLIRYLLKFPLWGDEMLLAENFLDRGFADCLQPLGNRQCAPLLYLWVELTAIKLLGFSEWPLRLFSLLAGVGSLFLFRHLATRLLRGLPLLLAVAIFAVSYYPIRHSAEVKPYASDLAVSLLLLVLAVEWLGRPEQSRWLWILAGLMPVALGLSFPAVFVAGGISLGIAWRVWQTGWRARGAFAAYNVAIVAAFGLFTWLSLQRQFAQTKDFMQGYWAESFPPLTEPLKLPAWFFLTHTGEMFAYPLGGERCGSLLTAACCAVGVWILIRQKQFTLLGAFGGVFLLGFIAAALKRYPYGDTARLVQYLAPPICLTAGLGAAALVTSLRSPVYQRHAVFSTAILFGVCGIGITVFDLVHPYKHHVDVIHRGFAQWFWNSHLSGGEVVFLPPPRPGSTTTSGGYCAFRCLQRIHAPRKPSAAAAAPTADRPILCIHYSTTGDQIDAPAVASALGQMHSQLYFVGQRKFTVNLSNSPRDVVFGDYEVYQFVRPTDPNIARRPSPTRSLGPRSR